MQTVGFIAICGLFTFLLNAETLNEKAVQFVNTKFSSLFHQPATPLKVGQGLHAALECVAQNEICQQRNNFARGVFHFILQKAGLNGNYHYEAELPLPGGYADLVIKPANGGRDRIVVEYKLLTSACTKYIKNTVLPEAERQVKQYAKELTKKGFNVVGMYVAVINEVQNGSAIALYQAA